MRRLRARLHRLRRRMLYEAQLAAESCVGARQFPHTEQVVWLLGVSYSTVGQQRDRLELDFATRVWFTYRRGFPEIGDEGPCSDRGWGCMLRCGQMLVAEALLRHALGRGWRWRPAAAEPAYVALMAMFADRPQAPYSIHQIALTGERVAHKPVGTWFGPNTVAQTLRHVAAHDTWMRPVLHVAMDSCLVRDDVVRECGAADGVWRPLLLMVPLRLGLSELNAVYVSGVRACFTVPHVLGIVGGTPNHALYFVGCVGDRLVYLDPHTTQPAADVGSKRTDEEREADLSYHSSQPSFMKITSLDPSLAVAFFCATETEFDSLCEHIQRLLIDNEKHPMFELCDKRPSWQTYDSPTEAAASFDFDSATGRLSTDTEDEFVVL